MGGFETQSRCQGGKSKIKLIIALTGWKWRDGGMDARTVLAVCTLYNFTI